MTEKPLKIAGVYWPLAPYDVAVNEMALGYEGPCYELPVQFLKGRKGVGLFSYLDKKDFEDYKKFFLLDENVECKEFPTNRKNVFFDSSKKLDQTKESFIESLGANKDEILQSTMKFFPQPKGSIKNKKPNLMISLEWQENNISPDCDKSFIVLHEEINPFKFDLIESIYICGESFLLSDKNKRPVVNALDDLFDLDIIIRSLPTEDDPVPSTINKSNYYCIIVSCSFFSDKIIDAVLALIVKIPDGPIKIDPKKKDSLCKNECLCMSIAEAFHGLSRLILDERKAWLRRWSLRLGDEIDRVMKDVTPEEVKDTTEENTGKKEKDPHRNNKRKEGSRFAAEALLKMAETLQFDSLGTKKKYKEIKNSLVTLLQKEKDQFFEESVENLFYAPGGHEARRKYVKEIIQPAYELAHRHIHGNEGHLLKGSLSIKANSQLKRYATHAPLTTRIMLRGAPGGGKGVTTKEYHHKVMVEVFNKSFNEFYDYVMDVSEKELEKVGEEKLEEWSGQYWHCFLKSVLKNIYGIFKLPEISDCIKNSKDTFLNQIGGTNFHEWNVPKVFIGNNEEKFEFYKNDTPQGKAIIRFWKAIDDKGDDDNIKRLELVDSYVAEYLIRLIEKIHFDKTDKTIKNKWEFNLFQITCGSLGGEGAELMASLRQLFGYSGNDGTRQAAPGLFQICSYVGGTLFLDEIADAPVRVQDNLLLPLEEGHVYREGWETTKEDVSNIRFISATHKDLHQAVAEYRETAGTAHPVGFRPDLLTRLATSPPVNVRPVSEYFNYIEGSGAQGRSSYMAEFIYILSFASKNGDDGFLRKVYEETDYLIGQFVKSRMAHELGSDEEKRLKVTSKISMRFFMNILKMRKKCPSANDSEQKSFILNKHIPETLAYLLDG